MPLLDGVSAFSRLLFTFLIVSFLFSYVGWYVRLSEEFVFFVSHRILSCFPLLDSPFVSHGAPSCFPLLDGVSWCVGLPEVLSTRLPLSLLVSVHVCLHVLDGASAFPRSCLPFLTPIVISHIYICNDLLA